MNDFCNEDFGGKAKGQSMSMDWKNSYFMLVFLYSLAGVGSSTPQLSFSPSHCPLCLTGILSCSCNLDSSFLLFPWDVTLTIEAMVQNLIFCCLDTFRSCIRGMFLFRRCSLSIFVDSWYSGLHYSLFFFFFETSSEYLLIGISFCFVFWMDIADIIQRKKFRWLTDMEKITQAH